MSMQMYDKGLDVNAYVWQGFRCQLKCVTGILDVNANVWYGFRCQCKFLTEDLDVKCKWTTVSNLTNHAHYITNPRY